MSNITFLTRNDDGFDSIQWAFEVHVKQADRSDINYALLTGNEDAPERIEFYAENDYRGEPVLTWEPPQDEGEQTT